MRILDEIVKLIPMNEYDKMIDHLKSNFEGFKYVELLKFEYLNNEALDINSEFNIVFTFGFKATNIKISDKNIYTITI